MSAEEVNTGKKEARHTTYDQGHEHAHEENLNKDHKHDEHCQHDDEEKKGGKSEKKVRKALGKLGMVKMEGVNRVTMRQKDSVILLVKDPEVYTSPQSENTFIIFGELTLEDAEKKLAESQIEQLKKEGEKLKPTTEKPPEETVQVIDETEDVSEEGLDQNAIETVVNEAKCTRQKAIKVLKKHNGDTIEAILELQSA